jgi:hypothetical protein
MKNHDQVSKFWRDRLLGVDPGREADLSRIDI